MLRLIAFLVLLAGPVAAENVTHVFSWKGAGGYKVRGAFTFDPSQLATTLVTGPDLICFEMFGVRDSVPIGDWALDDLTPDTPWIFHFDMAVERLLVPGDAGLSMPQAWNMGGVGNDCGADGFGLNLGSAYQDVCIDNQLIFDSQIAPSTPFASRQASGYRYSLMECPNEMFLSALEPPM